MNASWFDRSKQLAFKPFELVGDNKTRLVLSTQFSLLVIKYDTSSLAPSVYQQNGIDIQGAIPGLILIGLIAVALLYMSNKKK